VGHPSKHACACDPLGYAHSLIKQTLPGALCNSSAFCVEPAVWVQTKTLHAHGLVYATSCLCKDVVAGKNMAMIIMADSTLLHRRMRVQGWHNPKGKPCKAYEKTQPCSKAVWPTCTHHLEC